MAFHDVQLPTTIERGAVGGPRFKTTIADLVTGFEQRNIDWSEARGEWDISYGVLNMEDQGVGQNYVRAIRDFHLLRRGSAHSFRFKDWADYQLGRVTGTVIHEFATGDGVETVFQIQKVYTDGTYTYRRDITKPISGIAVYVNAVLQVEGGGNDYTIDLLTGIITFNSAPADTLVIGVIGEFDSAVRFGNDKLNISVEQFNAGSLPAINLLEVRGE